MNSSNLAKNPNLLIRYTADEAEKELSAIEGHGGRIGDSRGGPIVAWCLSCVRKHLGYLTELSDECVKGSCYQQPVWKELKKWAAHNREKVTQAIRGERAMPESEIQEIITGARGFRKEMEKLALSGPGISQSEELL